MPIGVMKLTLGSETNMDLMLTPEVWNEEIEALEQSGNLRNQKLAYTTKQMFAALFRDIDKLKTIIQSLEGTTNVDEAIKRGAKIAQAIPPEVRRDLVKSLFPDRCEHQIDEMVASLDDES